MTGEIIARPSSGSAASRPVRLVVLLALGALASKFLGLLREVAMARTFGASVIADSFRGSVSAVLLPLGPLLNESTPAILIPMCRAWAREDRGARELAEMVIALALTATAFMGLVQWSGAWWVSFIVGGFSPEAQKLVLEFIRVMASMMPAAVVLNCLAAADIAQGRSRISAVRAGVINVFVTTGIVAYAVTGKLGFLPWSFAVSFNAIAVWGLWLLRREGSLRFSGVSVRGVGASWREFMRRLRPLLAQPIVEQLHGWTERFVASGLVVGTLASLDYARTLTESAALIVAQPLGMAVLYKGAMPDDTRTVLALSAGVLAVALPASLYLALFAQDIVRIVFQRGAFDDAALLLTSGSLRGIAAGLWALTLGFILLRLLNNAGRNGLAAGLLAAAFLTNAGMSLIAGHIAGPGGYGSLWLGLGEAARGVVLLAGVAVALRIVWPLLKMILLCAGPLMMMAWLCFWISEHLHTPFWRLVAGGGVTAATAAILLIIVAPATIRRVLERWRFKRAALLAKSSS